MRQGSLLKPESFQRQGRWLICKLCDAESKEKEKMNMGAARIHENSKQHVHQVEKEERELKNVWAMPPGGSEWGMSTSDWSTKTDKLTLMVEYWYKGVQAADRGEELKFELFLETLED